MSPSDDENIARGRNRKATAFAIAVFTVTAAYAIIRYTAFGPVKPVPTPLYILNKAVAWSSLVAISVALSIGPLARLWPRRFTGHLAYRKLVGVLGFVLASGHVLLLPRIVARREDSWVAGQARAMVWRRTQRWAVWALTGTLVHLLYGSPNWVRPGTWYGGLPPMTLLCALTVAVVLLRGIKPWRPR